jgi:formylglycine-generating enzyme required for sulfatase activity
MIKVETDPEGAKVEVDSGQKGVSPVILEVPAGERKVKISRDGYLSKSQEINLIADQVIRLQVKLSPSAAIAAVAEGRGKDLAEMVLISEGESRRGSEVGSENRFLKAFWIDKFEVTNAQYARFVEEAGHRKPGYWEDPAFNQPAQPVVGVSWEDAKAYARWAGKRLLSEAEWEKAARGVDGRMYPWGDDWMADRCNSAGGQDGFEGPSPVGSFPSGASPYGVMDMAGNVWEWIADEPGPDAPPESKLLRIGKGGSWTNPRDGVQVTSRAKGELNLADCIIGFRCAMDAQ